MNPLFRIQKSRFALAAGLAMLSAQAFAQYTPYPATPHYLPSSGVVYYPTIQPVSAWPAGAAIGSIVGAAASGGNPASIFAGALLGGVIGHAATAPYVVPAAPAYPPQPAAAAGGSGGRAFAENWQQFAAPPGAAGASGTDFAQRWQTFFEPAARR